MIPMFSKKRLLLKGAATVPFSRVLSENRKAPLFFHSKIEKLFYFAPIWLNLCYVPISPSICSFIGRVTVGVSNEG